MTAGEVQRADQLIAYYARRGSGRDGATRDLERLRDEARRKAGQAVAAVPAKPFEPIPPAEPGCPLSFRPVPGLTAPGVDLRPCGSEFDVMWRRCPVRHAGTRLDRTAVLQPGHTGPNCRRVLGRREHLGRLGRHGRSRPVRARRPAGPLEIWPPTAALRGDERWRNQCWALSDCRRAPPGPRPTVPALRNWIALVCQSQPADGPGKPGFTATVIHTAAKTSESPEDPPDQTFRTWWKAEYADPGQPGRRLLLIGRGGRPQDPQGDAAHCPSTWRRFKCRSFQVTCSPPSCTIKRPAALTAASCSLRSAVQPSLSPRRGPDRTPWTSRFLTNPDRDFGRGRVTQERLLVMDGKCIGPDTTGTASRRHRGEPSGSISSPCIPGTCITGTESRSTTA